MLGGRRFLFGGHSYTPDFQVEFSEAAAKHLPLNFTMGWLLTIDVKPAFLNFGGGREFAINRKWLYQIKCLGCGKEWCEPEFDSTRGCPSCGNRTEVLKHEDARDAGTGLWAGC